MPNVSPSELRRLQQLFPDRAVLGAIANIGGTTQLMCADGSNIYIDRDGVVQ